MYFLPRLITRRRKSGAKVQQKMHMTKYFTEKMHFFCKKSAFWQKNDGHGLHFATVASGEWYRRQ